MDSSARQGRELLLRWRKKKTSSVSTANKENISSSRSAFRGNPVRTNAAVCKSGHAFVDSLVFFAIFFSVTEDFSMNAVMRLNQYKRGLEYRLTSQTGPVHEPVFTMVVDVNGKTYEATGPSKKAAKLNVATKARLVFVFL